MNTKNKEEKIKEYIKEMTMIENLTDQEINIMLYSFEDNEKYEKKYLLLKIAELEINDIRSKRNHKTYKNIRY